MRILKILMLKAHQIFPTMDWRLARLKRRMMTLRMMMLKRKMTTVKKRRRSPHLRIQMTLKFLWLDIPQPTRLPLALQILQRPPMLLGRFRLGPQALFLVSRLPLMLARLPCDRFGSRRWPLLPPLLPHQHIILNLSLKPDHQLLPNESSFMSNLSIPHHLHQFNHQQKASWQPPNQEWMKLKEGPYES